MNQPNQPWGPPPQQPWPPPQQPWPAPYPAQQGQGGPPPPEGWGLDEDTPTKPPSSTPMVVSILLVVFAGFGALLMTLASMTLLVQVFGQTTY